MSKRKGLSFDEKKSTLLAAMQAHATFYTLKELEVLGRSKGVIPQAVKDVVEGLVSSGDVQTDRVGSQALFWALPSQQVTVLRAKKQKLEEEAERMRREIKALGAEADELRTAQIPSEEEAAALRIRVNLERKRRDELKEKVDILERCSPEKVQEMKKQIAIAKEAANRWADNIHSVRSIFLREQGGQVSATMFNTTFNLPEDFDYLE